MMTTIRNLRPLPTLPADDAGRARWLADNGPVTDYPPITIDIDPVAFVAAGGAISETGQLVVSPEQRKTLAQAAYDNGGSLTGGEAIAALQAARQADLDKAQAAYDAFKAAATGIGAGLVTARQALQTAQQALGNLPENAPPQARAAAETALQNARAALDAADGPEHDAYRAAVRALKAVRYVGYPPADVIEAIEAAKVRLSGGNVRSWEASGKGRV